MARVKIDLPESFSFSTEMQVRITDLNYGDHVGNDSVLSFLHEARVRYLKFHGYTELDLSGVSIIMADAAIIYKKEMHYGDELLIHVQPAEFSRTGFDLIYKIEKKSGGGPIPAVIAKTAIVCFDYASKKVASLPDAVKMKLTS